MSVQLTTRAKAEFDAAIAFLSEENARAADHLRARIEKAIDSLSTLPNRGRPGRIEGTRELLVGTTPYAVVYTISDDRVRIVRVRHTSQDPSP